MRNFESTDRVFYPKDSGDSEFLREAFKIWTGAVSRCDRYYVSSSLIALR